VQAACAGAAAVTGVVLVWGMLPGPNRQVIWKLLATFAVSVLAVFACCIFLPFFGIAVDATLTNGPDLVVEQLLLLDALALTGLFFHRRLLAGVSSMGQRMATRMRYSKIGGTHLPGDTSEIGAALAMSGAGGQWAGRSGLGFGGPGVRGWLGTRHRLMGHVASMADGSGMPFDFGRVLSEAGAEASRGLAPLGIATVGARLGARGAWGLLVGKRPDDFQLAKWRGELGQSDESAPGRGQHVADDVRMVSTRTGEIMDDPVPAASGRLLPASRVHNRLLRLRGYRILSRSARITHGATVGLPRTVRAVRQFGTDAGQQGQAWRDGIRRTGEDWRPVARGVATAARTTATGVDRLGQRAFVAGQVHGADAADRARGAARDAGVAAGIRLGGAGRPEVRDAQVTQSRPEDPSTDARRRILDALMQAQRSTWSEPRRWASGTDDTEGTDGGGRS
jgi:hypothetical protein